MKYMPIFYWLSEMPITNQVILFFIFHIYFFNNTITVYIIFSKGVEALGGLPNGEFDWRREDSNLRTLCPNATNLSAS